LENARELSGSNNEELAGIANLAYKTNDANMKFHSRGLIVRNISPIPAGSEAYSRLIEIYGSQLEMYLAISGRLQLLYVMMLFGET